MNIQLVDKIKEFNIPVVEFHNSVTDPAAFIDEVSKMSGVEGFIIAWDNGYRIKIKAEEYVLYHKTKDNLTLEKNLVELIVTEKLDDAKAFMLDEDRHRVEQFEAEFWDGFYKQVQNYERYYNSVVASGLDRKRYALEWKPTIERNDPVAPQIVFGCFAGKNVSDMLLDILRKNCNTQTKIDAVRYLWGGARWDYHFEGDN